MGSKFGCLIICLLSMSCKCASKLQAQQGIEGMVIKVSGNQMPSPDIPRTPQKGFKTTLYIYELTNLSQVVKQNESAFYSTIYSKFVTKVETKEDGKYKVSLPEGKYSLFVKKGELFYANIFDGEGNIAPVTIEKGKMTTVVTKVDYDAVY